MSKSPTRPCDPETSPLLPVRAPSQNPCSEAPFRRVERPRCRVCDHSVPNRAPFAALLAQQKTQQMLGFLSRGGRIRTAVLTDPNNARTPGLRQEVAANRAVPEVRPPSPGSGFSGGLGSIGHTNRVYDQSAPTPAEATPGDPRSEPAVLTEAVAYCSSGQARMPSDDRRSAARTPAAPPRRRRSRRTL